jgi:hypothetical protein
MLSSFCEKVPSLLRAWAACWGWDVVLERVADNTQRKGRMSMMRGRVGNHIFSVLPWSCGATNMEISHIGKHSLLGNILYTHMRREYYKVRRRGSPEGSNSKEIGQELGVSLETNRQKAGGKMEDIYDTDENANRKDHTTGHTFAIRTSVMVIFATLTGSLVSSQ